MGPQSNAIWMYFKVPSNSPLYSSMTRGQTSASDALGDSDNALKRSNRTGTNLPEGKGVLFPVFPSPNFFSSMASGSENSKYLSQKAVLPDGFLPRHSATLKPRGSYDHLRPTGCVFPHSHLSFPQAVPSICRSRRPLPVQGAAIRPQIRPKDFHKMSGSSGGCSKETKTPGVSLPGRLVNQSAVTSIGSVVNSGMCRIICRAGPDSKHGKVILPSCEEHHVLRGDSGHHSKQSVSFQGETTEANLSIPSVYKKKVSFSTPLLGTLSSCMPLIPFCRLRMRPLQEQLDRQWCQAVGSFDIITISPAMVQAVAWWTQRRNICWPFLPYRTSSAGYYHQCIPRRLGGFSLRPPGQWSLEVTGTATSHQSAGTQGSGIGIAGFPDENTGLGCANQDRQHNSNAVPQQIGRYEIAFPVPGSPENLEMGS